MLLLKNSSIRTRILLFPALMVLGLLVLQAGNSLIEHRLKASATKRTLLAGHQNALKSVIDVTLTSIANRMQPGMTQDQITQLVFEETDPIRFYANDEGYVFSYLTDGTRINVPPNKSGNGKNFWDLQDKKENFLIRDIVAQAKAGGGFTQYYFEKPGQGVQPKLSYSRLVPGTNIIIGTGVYTDNVQAEQEDAKTAVEQEERQYFPVRLGLFLGLFTLAVVGSVFIERSITHPVRTTTHDLNDAIIQLSLASGEILDASHKLTDSSVKQAEGLEETTANVAEISTMTHDNAQRADQARNLAGQARVAAESGNEAMGRMQTAILDIQRTANETANIVKAIDEIAFQTNLLALNASVEAARAGDAGKGFAVVAEEVRNLAQRAADAASNTSKLIHQSVDKAQRGVGISKEVAEMLQNVVDGIAETSDLAANIAEDATRQNVAIGQIRTAVTTLDLTTQGNAATAEECSSAALVMDRQTAVLRQSSQGLVQMSGGTPVTVTRQ